MSSTLQSMRMPLMRERCTGVLLLLQRARAIPRPLRFAVGTELGANFVRDIARGRGEGPALLIGPSGLRLHPFGDDPSIPRAFKEDLERSCAAGIQAEVVDNRPGRGERQ